MSRTKYQTYLMKRERTTVVSRNPNSENATVYGFMPYLWELAGSLLTHVPVNYLRDHRVSQSGTKLAET